MKMMTFVKTFLLFMIFLLLPLNSAYANGGAFKETFEAGLETGGPTMGFGKVASLHLVQKIVIAVSSVPVPSSEEITQLSRIPAS